jgi:tetratricopeptide (TPR) repeat protein
MIPDGAAFAAYLMRDHGAPAGEWFRRAIPSAADTTGAANFWIGAVAAEEGRWDLYRDIVAEANAFADTVDAQGDTLFAATVRGAVRGLEAYATWRRGDRETALRELVAAQREATGWGPATLMNRTIRWWIVRLLLDLDRAAEAEPYLLSLDEDPYAHLELGRLYERLGETAKARERYELFVTAWHDADPELQPKVAEALQALTRLGFRPRG